MINFDARTGMIVGLVAPFYHPETLNALGGFFTFKTRFRIDVTNGGSAIFFQPNNVVVGKIARFDAVAKGLEVVAYLDQTQIMYPSLAAVLLKTPEEFVFGTVAPQQFISVDTLKKQVLEYPILEVYLTRVQKPSPVGASFV